MKNVMSRKPKSTIGVISTRVEAFLLRTFFFVFIGISVQINRMDWLMWGAIITLTVFAARIIAVKLIVARDTPLLDKAVMSIMVPKGLGAAVIATLPLQRAHPDGIIIQSVCFAVILFSTLYCVGLFFLTNTGITLPFYRLVFGRDKVVVQFENLNQQVEQRGTEI